MKSTSVIIVTFNSQDSISASLTSLSKDDLEIVVIDNNSSDQTLEKLKSYKDIKLIKNSKNLGFGKAINIGVKNSQGEYLFFLNPDCIVQEKTVEKLSAYLDQNLEVGVVGPKLLSSDGSVQTEMAKFPAVLPQILILLRLHRLRFFQKLVYPKFDYEKTQEAEHLMGAALMIRRAVFEEVGGFDEKFFLWFEETDLLKRISDKGYKIVYVPEAIVTHLVGQSTKQLNPIKKQTIWNRSLLHYFRKHKGWVKQALLLPFILISYPAALVVYTIKR